MPMGISSGPGMLDDPNEGEELLDGGSDEELEFSDEEIEEAMGKSPLDDLEGRDYEDHEGEDGTTARQDEGKATGEEPNRANPKTGQLRREDGTFTSEKLVAPEGEPKDQPGESPAPQAGTL